MAQYISDTKLSELKQWFNEADRDKVETKQMLADLVNSDDAFTED